MTSCARSCAWSFTIARLTWVFAVAGLTKSRSAISRFRAPNSSSSRRRQSTAGAPPPPPGTRSLKAQLSRYGGPVDTRSELERLVYELCDDRGLPRPLVNTVIEGKVRDFHWPQCRLVVEADSYRWHRSPSALNDDRERDVQLTLAGYRMLRFTWEQVTRRREYVARALLSALRAP
jgi:very-short-patch-repair endonuclease